MPNDFMITPINERFNGFSQILHLSKSESKDLNKVINQIADLQIQKKNQSLEFTSLPQNTTDFLKIHKKIDSLKTKEKDPAKLKLLDQVNNASRKFEQVILQSLNSGNAADLKGVETLINDLHKIIEDPGLSPDLREDLAGLEKNMLSVGDIYQEISEIDLMLGAYDEIVDATVESLVAKHEALEKGVVDFSIEPDLSVLKLVDLLVGFYEKYKNDESLPLYHEELIARLKDEAYNLRFNHEEFFIEYKDAVRAEVLKTLQAYHQQPGSSAQEERNQTLLITLIQEKDKLALAKATLDSHIDALNPPQRHSEALFNEFKAMQKSLKENVLFLESQIKMLSEKQTVGVWGRWTISSRDKKVEHNVRVVRESEENVPNGLGKKLLLFSVWGLSKIGKFQAFGQFVNQSYQAISTGVSPMKSTADLMSLIAYAKHFSTLGIGEQQALEYDVSAIQGVFNGYIPFTETFVKEHPDAAVFLEKFKNEAANASESKMASGGKYIQHEPIQKITQAESNIQALRYIGEQVREHFNAEGRQLVFENPAGAIGGVINNNLPEAKPESAFSLLAKELAESVKEAKGGVPVEDNKSFQMLQSDAKATFGAELPEEWFTKWIADQEWDNKRLDNFQNWFSENLECQARHHFINSNIHVKNPETAVVFNVLDPGAVNIRHTHDMDVNDSPHMRTFNVIEDLADAVKPEQLFQNPLTSDTPHSYSPLKAAYDVYQFVAGKAQLF